MSAQEALQAALVAAWDEFFQEGLNLGVSHGFKKRHVRALSITYACKKLEKTCKEIAGKHADQVFADPGET
jgi:flagellar biosynthesis/type III secretory pathway protein FliH